MPIDTSSYYPEVNGPDGDDGRYSLNNRKGGLFGMPEDEKTSSSDRDQVSPQHVLVNTNNALNADGGKDGYDGVEFLDTVSEWLSWLMIPLFMPTYGLMLAFGLSVMHVVPLANRISVTLVVFAITAVLPMLLICLLKKVGAVNDLGLNGQKERGVPYAITILCYLAAAWFLWFKGAPGWVWMFFTGGALAAVINMSVNFKWKISAHSAGVAGIVALLLRIMHNGSPDADLLFWLLASIAVSGILGTARVWLGRHTVWQVLAGYAVGFASVFILTGVVD